MDDQNQTPPGGTPPQGGSDQNGQPSWQPSGGGSDAPSGDGGAGVPAPKPDQGTDTSGQVA